MGRKIHLVTGLLFVLISLVSCGGGKNGKNSEGENGKAKQYVCSMHPQVLRDEPGDCPICGMMLIEKREDNSKADSTLEIVISQPDNYVLANVEDISAEITERPVLVKADGLILFDTRKIKTVSAKFGGFIEKSFVKYRFQKIRKGFKIFNIYSPDIYTEKWNYIKLIQAFPDQDNINYEARQWLEIIGLSKGQIDSLKRTIKPDYHLAVYADASGYAVDAAFDPERYLATSGEEGNSGDDSNVSLGVNQGVYVETGQPLFRLLDAGSLMADIKVKANDAALISKGSGIVISSLKNPGLKRESIVSSKELSTGGPLIRIRAFIKNEGDNFLPGSPVEAEINCGVRSAVWLPVSAVIMNGQNAHVFVNDGKRYTATEVITGVRSGDVIEIKSGLAAGVRVALNASLLVDSDAVSGN